MNRLTQILMLVIAGMICMAAVAANGPATTSFKKLESLAGNWEGKDEQGSSVKTSFKTIASATALMETLDASGMEEMVTLYSIDGDSIVLVHYCPTNNQPRMRAIPPPGEVQELTFSFQGAGNLPNLAVGHEHKLVMEFTDQDHITERWTWRKNGKDTEMVFHFTRVH